MGLTTFSFVLLPLCVLWAFRPIRLLQVLLIAGIFEAAAAAVIGSFGLQPALVPALTAIGYIGLQWVLGARFPGQHRVLLLLAPLLCVIAWAVIGSYLLPRLFEGQAMVWPEKALPPFVLTPLSPDGASLNQDLYLIVNAMVVVLVAMFLTRTDLSPGPVVGAYLLSGLVALVIGIWEFGSRIAGLPFPDGTFYSNPGWSILTEQRIGSIPRVNGSFSEPSSFGSYMTACACCAGWLMLKGHRHVLIRPVFIGALLGVLLSTSATGIASLGAAAALVVVMALAGGSTRAVVMLGRVGLPILALGVVIVLISVFLVPDLLANLSQILDTVLNKQDSSSYQDRTTTDLDSIKAMLDTYGLGVGWGNNRSSSLIPGLLASVGLPGLLGLLWFAASLAIRVTRVKRAGCSPQNAFIIDGASAAIVGYLLPACLSAPTISAVGFYVLLALLVAGIVRAEAELRASPARV